MNLDKLSDNQKQLRRENMLNEIFTELTNKTNRYIFYCPDIMVVNNLTKLVYETAWEAKKLGYNVLVLHEINGFKCKWLFENEENKHLRQLEVDYIIRKKSAKSKKTRADYSFKPSDTLVIPDQFQEMLDNISEVKLIQKVVLVSSYTGLSSIQPGHDYNNLGVSKVLFTEPKLLEDYSSLFQFEHLMLDKYPINKTFFNKEKRKVSDILPNVCISNIGNNDLTQEIINVFYNKYPQLRTFTFKIMPRDNFDYYLDSLKQTALYLVLDKNMGNRQMIYEALAMGVPVATFKRREVDATLAEHINYGTDAFEIADSIAEFVQAWLTMPTSEINTHLDKFVSSLKLEEYSYENYNAQLHIVLKELQDNRVKYFSGIKQSLEENHKKEVELTVV
jgi:hypothetical protein